MRCSRPGFAVVTLGALIGGCSGHPTEPTHTLTFNFDFSRGTQGFVAGFADYPPDHADSYELTSGYRALPPLAGVSVRLVHIRDQPERRSLHVLQGTRSAGLLPGSRYGVTVSVEIATDTPAGCVGVGGAPGESVWIKAGATAVEPLPVRDGSYLRMNVDIGNQSVGGTQAVVLGNIANSRSCEQPREWERKSLQGGSTPVPISTPSNGQAWLLFGVDSGFESRTAIYFTRAAVTFTPL